jgi:hypothetical protein
MRPVAGEFVFTPPPVFDGAHDNRVSAKNFEKLTEETGLTKPLVRRRVPELVNMV